MADKNPLELAGKTLPELYLLAQHYALYQTLHDFGANANLGSYFKSSELSFFKTVDHNKPLQEALITLHQHLQMVDAQMPHITMPNPYSTPYNPADQLLHGLNNAVAGGITGAIAQNIGQYFHPNDPHAQNALADCLTTIGHISLGMASATLNHDIINRKAEQKYPHFLPVNPEHAGKPSETAKETAAQKADKLLKDPLNLHLGEHAGKDKIDASAKAKVDSILGKPAHPELGKDPNHKDPDVHKDVYHIDHHQSDDH